MSLISLLVLLVIVGVILYLVNTIVPLPAWIKTVINAIAALVIYSVRPASFWPLGWANIKAEMNKLQEENAALVASVAFWKEVAEKNGEAGTKYVDQQLRIMKLEKALESILRYCEGGDACAGSEHKPCHIYEHEVARKALTTFTLAEGVKACQAIDEVNALNGATAPASAHPSGAACTPPPADS